MRRSLRAAGLVVLTVLVCPGAFGSGRVVFVPWKVLERGTEAAPARLTLYWIPASPDELRRSELVTSRPLALYASRCVAMFVIRADDAERLERLRAAGPLPMAVLIDGDRELARVENESGLLRAASVEAMVRAAFEEREREAAARLDHAARLTEAGETEEAIDLYRTIGLERCAFPRLAKAAARALRRLGAER